MGKHSEIKLTLPWPPSVNGYWRSIIRGKGPKARPTQIVSAKGRQYRLAATEAAFTQYHGSAIHGDLHVAELFYPPDRRRRDIDNHRKAYRDALTNAGVWGDDTQIKSDEGRMMDPDPSNPRVEVSIQTLGGVA